MLKLILVFLLGACAAAPQPAPKRPEIVHTVVSVILTGDGMEHCVGSGIAIHSVDKEIYQDLYILTAKHVVKIYNPTIGLTYKVKFKTGENYKVNQIFDHKLSADASILRCRAYSNHPVATLTEKEPEPLREVYSIGYPMQIGPIITIGLINYYIANISEDSWVCTAPAFYGNSGGGVFYKDTHELVGLTIMIGGTRADQQFSPVPHIHLFLPVSFIKDWIKEIVYARPGK